MGNKICCENGNVKSLSPLDLRDLAPIGHLTDAADNSSQKVSRDKTTIFITLDKLEISKAFSTYLQKEFEASNQERSEQEKEIFESAP